ncbi:hypothetical protein GCM10025783_11220 [Amnibacterium soli]|uniref:Tat pathway signal sequence domain protein n=1 Tax=Amnibacterium soli TaxID=1282736 RepID=A0ABP8YZN8_9MICO
MRVAAARSAEAERLDALRRRLYAPDVTEAEVAAYRAAAAQQQEVGAVASAPARRARTTTSPRTPRRRTALIAGGAALLVAAASTVLVTTHPLAGLTASSSPSPSPLARLIEGEVPTSLASRSEFVASLQGGREPGLLEYLYEHRTYLPQAISTPQRAASTEYAGQGSSTIALDPSSLAQDGGRVTVFLVLDRAATYSWRAQRIAQRNDRSGPVLELAEQAGRNRAGEPTTTTFRYDGRAPTRLAVYTDETVKWGAVVVFTD